MSTKTAFIRARTQPELKLEAEKVLRSLGLSPSAAINMFYRQVVLRQSLPFDVALPNASTRRAMAQAERGEDLIEADALKELVEKLDDND